MGIRNCLLTVGKSFKSFVKTYQQLISLEIFFPINIYTPVLDFCSCDNTNKAILHS